MAKEKILTGHFYLQSDDGRRFLVFEYTEYQVVQNFGQPPQRIPDSKVYVTYNGTPVNFDGKRTYEIAGLGVPVKRAA